MKRLLLTILIIVGLLLAGWASARTIEESNFQQKVKYYLKQAQQKVIPALEKPLTKVDNWFKAQFRDIKSNFYKELEEMKVSVLDLLKWSWQEGTKEVESEL